MTFFEVVKKHIEGGARHAFARESKPHIHFDFDAAEGVRFWSMNHETDELEEHSFSGEEIMATDWMIKEPA